MSSKTPKTNKRLNEMSTANKRKSIKLQIELPYEMEDLIEEENEFPSHRIPIQFNERHGERHDNRESNQIINKICLQISFDTTNSIAKRRSLAPSQTLKTRSHKRERGTDFSNMSNTSSGFFSSQVDTSSEEHENEQGAYGYEKNNEAFVLNEDHNEELSMFDYNYDSLTRKSKYYEQQRPASAMSQSSVWSEYDNKFNLNKNIKDIEPFRSMTPNNYQPIYDKLNYGSKRRYSLSSASSMTSTSSLSSSSNFSTITKLNMDDYEESKIYERQPPTYESRQQCKKDAEEDIYEEIANFCETNSHYKNLKMNTSKNDYETLDEFRSNLLASHMKTGENLSKNASTTASSTRAQHMSTIKPIGAHFRIAKVQRYNYKKEYTINEIFQNLHTFKEEAREQELNVSVQQSQPNVEPTQCEISSPNHLKNMKKLPVQLLRQLFEKKQKPSSKQVTNPSEQLAKSSNQLSSDNTIQKPNPNIIPSSLKQHIYVNERISKPINV
jgi:hypothetical protein